MSLEVGQKDWSNVNLIFWVFYKVIIISDHSPLLGNWKQSVLLLHLQEKKTKLFGNTEWE